MNALNNQWMLRLALLVGMVATLGVVGNGVLIAIGAEGADWDSNTERIVFGTLTALAGTAMTAGLLLSQRIPRIGLTLLVAGVAGISILWYWVAFITIPAGIVLFGIAYSRRHERSGLRSPAME